MQSLVGLTQLFECRFEKCLVLVSLARTEACQSAEAHIDADCCWHFPWQCIRHFHLDGHTPPVRRFRDPGPRHAAGETQILCHVDPAQLGNPDAMITQLELIIGEIEAGFAALLAFEAWAAGLFLEESRKRLAQVEKGLIRSIFGHFPGPGEELSPDLVELRAFV